MEGTKNQTKPQQINTFWWEGKTGIPGEKPLRAEKRTNIRDPHYSDEIDPILINGMRVFLPLHKTCF